MTAKFVHTDDVAGAAWIAPRLQPSWASIASLLPGGFECYVRVFHAAGGHKWSDVCAATGATAHPLMQWHAISRGWDGDEPQQGTLGEADLARVAQALGVDQSITIGMWTGYGQIAAPGEIPGSSFSFSALYTDELPSGPATSPRPAELSEISSGAITNFDVDIRSAPLLELPNREYALFRGTLSTLATPGWRTASGWAWLWDETANLAWPDDESWFIASEIDFDSTVIGCSAEVAERILVSGLEVHSIAGDADLTSTGDRIND